MTVNEIDRVLGPHPDVDYHPSPDLDELPDWCTSCESFSLPVHISWTPREHTAGYTEACLDCARRALDEVCGEHRDGTPIVVEVPAELLESRAAA